jgi:hypothetical protein
VQDRTRALGPRHSGVGARRLTRFAHCAYARTLAAGWRLVATLSGSGVSGLVPSAYLRGAQPPGERSTSLSSADNEVCLAWLADALQQLRREGRTKAVGYLDAVLDEVVFEMEIAPGRDLAHRRRSEDGKGLPFLVAGERGIERHLDRGG